MRGAFFCVLVVAVGLGGALSGCRGDDLPAAAERASLVELKRLRVLAAPVPPFGARAAFRPILAVDAPNHLTHVEHFNGDTSAGPTISTDLVAHGSGTRMTMVMRYATPEARAEAIDNGFTDGLDKVYGRVESLLIACR